MLKIATTLLKQLTSSLNSLELTETPFICYCLTLQNIWWLQVQLLKLLYPKLFQVTCVTHLLAQLCYESSDLTSKMPDQLIAKVKLVTVNNKTRQSRFATIGHSPQTVLTRWGSWLKCCFILRKEFT